MTYAFPPPLYPAWVAQAAPVALFGCSIIAVVAFIITLRYPPRWWQIAAWIATLVAAAYATAWVSRAAPALPWELLLCLWPTVLFAIYVTLIRLDSLAGRLCFYFSVLILFFWSFTPFVGSGPVAKSSTCRNSLRQVWLALESWAKQHDGRPPPPTVSSNDQPPRSWRVEVLLFLDEFPIGQMYRDAEPWDSAANSALARYSLRVYQCPASPPRSDEQSRTFTDYALVTGPHTAFPPAGPLKPDEIPDGATHTGILVEACGQRIVWTEPRDLDLATTPIGINVPGERPNTSPGILSSYHADRQRYRDGGSINVLCADGSVRRLSANTDPTIIRALLTADGGEPPSE